MGIEDTAKKFLGEPLVWVSVAMVGVVLMGPTAANLARKVVGGDRNRGNVDQHGETIVDIRTAEPITENVPDTKGEGLENPNAPGDPSPHRIAMLSDDAQEARVSDDSRNTVASKTPVGNSDLTALDVREEVAKQKEEARKRLGDSDATATAEREVDAPSDDKRSGMESASDTRSTQASPSESDAHPSKGSFDVDQMVDEVKREMNAQSQPAPQDLPGTKATPTETKPSDAKPRDVPVEQGSSSKRPRVGANAMEEAQIDAVEPAVTPPDVLPGSNDVSPMPATEYSPLTDEVESIDEFVPTENPTQEYLGESMSPAIQDEGTFSQWDEPMKFKSRSDNNDGFSNLSAAVVQSPRHDSVTSIPAEDGGTWWDASISQQFWPNRQGQFASIDSVVFVALQNSAQIQILNDHPQIEETFVQQREADFDWSAFVDASWSSLDEPIRSELQTGSRTGRFVQEELYVGSGLQKRLESGGQLRVGSTIGTVDNNSIFLAPPDQGTATFSLDYRQPLLRGRGREVNQSQIVLAKLSVESTRHAVKQEMQRHLVEVVTAYWELYRARGVLSQRHRNFMRASEIAQRLSDRSSSSAAASQWQRAKAAASARHSEVIDAEYLVADAQERLMNLTHGDTVANSNQIEIIPTDAPPQFALPHSLSSVTEAAIRNRPEVQEVLASIKAASVRQVIALDGLKPQLDAIISSYVAGVRGDKDVGNAINDQFTAGDPSYSVGMSFEIPIGRRSANAGVKRQEIQRRLLQNKLRKTLGDVSTSARSAFRDVYRLLAITENNQHVVNELTQALNAIQQQTNWFQKNDPSAALYLNDLLVSQDRLAAAEQNLLDSQARLAIAYVTLKRATGELLQDGAVVSEASCQNCAGGECGCSTVTQATWDQPIEQEFLPQQHQGNSILDSGREYIEGNDSQFHLPPSRQKIDVPIERLNPQPGVTPVPGDSNTAGEYRSAPRSPRTSKRTKMKPAARS